jgi:hypothetical protein
MWHGLSTIGGLNMTPDRNERRRRERARRRMLFEQLRLQADILCDSHREEARQTIVLNRMLNIILDIVGPRKINDVSRQALADHFYDCAHRREGSVQLGGEGERNALHLDGAFRIDELARRIVWSEARTGEVIEAAEYAQ